MVRNKGPGLCRWEQLIVILDGQRLGSDMIVVDTWRRYLRLGRNRNRRDNLRL